MKEFRRKEFGWNEVRKKGREEEKKEGKEFYSEILYT